MKCAKCGSEYADDLDACPRCVETKRKTTIVVAAMVLIPMFACVTLLTLEAIG